jgi:ribonucleoside-triphosphate reductase
MSPTYSICSEHGYLSGEQKICPKCGKVTEVYSRITGYYRPVQNWNDGKLQEYANRTTYQIDNVIANNIKETNIKDNSVKPNNAKHEKITNTQPTHKPSNGKTLLFTTKTCPNCRLAKEYLKDVDYVTIDAEENSQLAVEYGVMQAPTLVIVAGQSRQKYVNVSNIKKYAEEYKGA